MSLLALALMGCSKKDDVTPAPLDTGLDENTPEDVKTCATADEVSQFCAGDGECEQALRKAQTAIFDATNKMKTYEDGYTVGAFSLDYTDGSGYFEDFAFMVGGDNSEAFTEWIDETAATDWASFPQGESSILQCFASPDTISTAVYAADDSFFGFSLTIDPSGYLYVFATDDGDFEKAYAAEIEADSEMVAAFESSAEATSTTELVNLEINNAENPVTVEYADWMLEAAARFVPAEEK